MKKHNQILSTLDYSLFKYSSHNRDINFRHVDKLMRSIENHNLLSSNPILINNQYEIVDGQHRLEAAKKLKIPIYYIVNDDISISSMISLNSSHLSWKMEDYLSYWIDSGNEDYRKLNEFIKKYNFNFGVALFWLDRSDEKNTKLMDFKVGKFKFNLNEITLKALESTMRLIQVIKDMDFKPIRMISHRQFHVACKQFFSSSLVDHDLFFIKVGEVPYKLKMCQNWQQYFEQFAEIYNYNLKKNKLKIVSQGKERIIK